MTVLAMSHGKLSWFDTLMRVERGEFRVEEAAAVLDLKRRQVFRLLKRLRAEGASGLISRKRGRPSNRRQAGIWKDRDARRPRPYQPRYRRDCRGELIQVDGSKHWWFEERGP